MTDQPSTSYEFAFQGRTAEEYRRLFDLDPTAWDSVLDCGAGPSSFTAAVRGRTDAVAVDPAYRAPASELRARAEASVERVASTFAGAEQRFVWEFYSGLEDRISYLERAHGRFLADFRSAPGRYVAAALPDLPFETDSFELVLAAHLLFMYDEWLDEEFHWNAIGELCRVARTEVCVYPLLSLDGTRSEYVDSVVTRLDDLGHCVERRPVPFEFQRGADEALVVEPAP